MTNTLVSVEALQYSANKLRQEVAEMRACGASANSIKHLLRKIDKFERAIAYGDMNDPDTVARVYNNAFDYRETVRDLERDTVDRRCVQSNNMKSPLNYL